MTAIGPSPAHDGGLSDVLKRGAVLATIGVAVAQVVAVATVIVLGRLLGPDAIGIFAAGSVATGLALVFVQVTFPQALIQREHDIDDAANTVLVATFATGLLLGFAVLVTSPLIGHLFHDSQVGMIAAATSGLILLQSFSSVPDALMQRAFQFKRRLIVDPATAIAFAVISIVFAVLGYGAWSMVIGTYASVATGVTLSWWLAKWRPFHGRFSFRICRELAGFSLPLLFDGIADRSRDMFTQVLVGRSLGTADLGQYRYGYRLASMPSMAVIQVCGYVLFPAFSRISGHAVRFREAYLRALGWMWFAAIPAGALLIVLGQPVVVLLLGEEWRAAGKVAAMMAGMGLGIALAAVSAEAIKGAGRSSLLNWITALDLVLGVGLIVLLLPFGLVGISIALSVTFLIVGFVQVGFARSVVDASFRDTVACLAPSTLSALLAFAVVFPLEHLVVRSDQYFFPLGLTSVVVECLLFMLVYLGVLRLVSPGRYRSVRGVTMRVVTRLRGPADRVL